MDLVEESHNDFPEPGEEYLKVNEKSSTADDGEDTGSRSCSCCSCCCNGENCRRKRRRHQLIGKRAKNCSLCFVRLYLIIPNAIFVIAGLTLAGIGIWIRIDRNSLFQLELLQHLPNVSLLIALERFPTVVISVGFSVAILSSMGCCGACAENACCLCLYTFILILVLVADAVLIIVCFIMRDKIILSLGISVQQQITTNYNSSTSFVFPVADENTLSNEITFSQFFTKSLDAIQNKLDCCGSFGPEDYESSAWFNRTRLIERETFVPASCCHLSIRRDVQLPLTRKLKECQRDAFLYIAHRPLWDSMKKSTLKTQGCHAVIFDTTQRTVSIIVGFTSAVVLLQILNLVFACVLLKCIRRRQDEILMNMDI